MSTPIPKSINLFDFSHGLTVNFKARANDSGPNDAGQATLNQLASIRTTAEHTIVCLDKGPYWRRDVFPDYKKGREREPEYGPIYDWTLERVRKDGYNIAFAPREEADDMMATLARIYVDEFHCTDVRLITADKDVAQCVNESVRWFSPILGKPGEFDIRDADWVKKKFGNVDWAAEEQEGLWPKDIALALAIMGDTSDKIPGIKGIGIKGAAKLINTYKTVEAMAQACVGAVEAAKMTGKPPAAFWKNYAAGMAELPKWLKLTTLNTEAALELHPLKYLERIAPEPLVAVELSDADDSGFEAEAEFPVEEVTSEQEIEWDRVAKETAERERAELAKMLPVEPVTTKKSSPPPVGAPIGHSTQEDIGPPLKQSRAPIIGKDPKADETLRKAAAEREEDARGAKQLAEREAEERAARTNRHGVVTPDPRVMDSQPGAPSPAAPSNPGTSAPSPSPAPAPGPAPVTQTPSAPAASAEVVPRSQGPQGERLAVVPFAAPSWELATQPRSPTEMAMVAARFYNSRFYGAHGNSDGTFAVIALGRELGLGAAASVEGFHIVNGRPFAKAVMLKALAERDPNCEWIMITSADDKHATIKTQHKKAGLLEYTYTIERAEAAGYLNGKNSENWKTKRQEMLEARATSKSVRRWYPGATFGLHSIEEAHDD